MAKAIAPLFSFGASGKLANSLVYFPWKGINAIRSYVIPANPRTKPQTDQRDRLEAAVDEWHGAAYTAADVTAWNRYAGILAKIMSGFNAMVQSFVNEAILTNTWERVRNAHTDGVLAAQFNVMCTKASTGNAPTVYYGTRKTHFPNSKPLADQGGNVWAATLTGLSKDTLYYFYIDVGSSGTDYGRTGIYSQRTAAA